MMSNKLIFGLVGLLVLLFLLFSSFFIVSERQQAIVLRFGEIVDVEETPGLYFKAPFIDTVQMLDDRILRFNLDDIRVQVSGGKFYVVDAFVAYRIDDPRRFRQAVSGSVPLAEQRLRTRLDAALRRVYGLRGFEAALSDERADMMREVAGNLRIAAEQLGLEIDDVRIRRTDLTAEVSQQTYERMQAERLAEAERLRARGREAAQRIRARADRQVEEILAEANRDSEILRGEGDAERNNIFANAYGQDPEFFDFYRSMNAYAAALENSSTTMVLSPSSEFFRYFQGAGGAGLQGLASTGAPENLGPSSAESGTVASQNNAQNAPAAAQSTEGAATASPGATTADEPAAATTGDTSPAASQTDSSLATGDDAGTTAPTTETTEGDSAASSDAAPSAGSDAATSPTAEPAPAEQGQAAQ